MGSKLDKALAQITKEYGSGVIMSLSDKPNAGIKAIPTGAPTLDIALGVGGFPLGRIVEIYGPQASGKTTLTLHVVANAQKMFPDKRAVFIDVEHALDPRYAHNLGVDLKNLLICQPSWGEQGLSVAESVVRSGEVSVVVVDSVAALLPKAELEAEVGMATMGLQARMIGQACRKMTAAISETGTLFIFINQLREKIGVLYGSPETTTGGKALPYYASVRVDVRAKEQLKDGQEVVGVQTRAKVKKNKVSPPFREADFTILYGKGVDRLSCVVDVGLKSGAIIRKGAFYSLNDSLDANRSTVQGKEALVEWLLSEEGLADKVLRWKPVQPASE